MKRRSFLQVEALEDRALPAVFGVPWPDATNLTVSFAPDGTDTSVGDSDLYATLDGSYPEGSWQYEILRAFQTWAEVANINFSFVNDSGDPLGADGVIQGDTRFGDIRIFAYEMSSEVVAIGSPFDMLAGTWSGDIKINSALTFGEGGYDLYSVFLHEIGHALGLDHSTDPASAMYEDYLTVRTGLTAEDIARVQALYGPRLPDAYDAKAPNETLDDASGLGATNSAFGDLTTRSDLDWYSFRLTGQTTGATVYLDVSGISLLAAKVSVYDDKGNLISSVGADAIGEDLTLHFDRLGKATTYYVRVEGATDDVFSVGSYRLDVIPDDLGTPNDNNKPLAPPNDQDNESGGAVSLQQRVYSTDARFDYVVRETLDDADDVDYYRVKGPTGDEGQVLTVFVWGLDGTAARPRVTLYDAQGNVLEGEVLVNEDGSFVFQYPAAKSGGTYLIAVSYDVGGAADVPTNYFLGVDFSAAPVALDAIAMDWFITPGYPDADTLVVTESQLFHFVLSAEYGPIRMEISDLSGQVLGVVQAEAGTTVTDKFFLHAGTYTIRVLAPAKAATYSLSIRSLSDPIGPTPLDLVFTPLPQPTPGSSYVFQQGATGTLVTNPPPSGGTTTGEATTSTPSPNTPALSKTGTVTPSLLFTGSAAETVVMPSSSLDSPLFAPSALPVSSPAEAISFLPGGSSEVALTGSGPSALTYTLAQMDSFWQQSSGGEPSTPKAESNAVAAPPQPALPTQRPAVTRAVSGSAGEQGKEEVNPPESAESETEAMPAPPAEIVPASAEQAPKEETRSLLSRLLPLWLFAPLSLVVSRMSARRNAPPSGET